MIPAIFTVGSAVSNEAKNIKIENKDGKLTVKCDIRGIPFLGQEANTDQERYGFVLRHKETGKIRVIERPPLLFRPAPAEEESQLTSAPVDRATFADNFGSGLLKRAVRDYQQREKMTGNKKQMKAVLAAATQEVLKTKEKETKPSNVLPPVLDLEASDPAQVYDLNAILPPQVRHALKDEAENLATATVEEKNHWLQEETYSKIVINRIAYLPHGKEQRLDAATRLVFLEALLKLRKKSAAQLRSSTCLSDMAHPVAQHLLNNFTFLTETGRRRVRCCPTWMKEKMMYHILVLLLHIDNYRTDFQDLINHFKMSSARLKQYFQVIGCKMEENAEGKCAVLKPPISFPESFKKQ